VSEPRTSSPADARTEAVVFGRYLGGSVPDERAVALYVKAMELRPVHRSARDDEIIRFVLRHPWALGLADSALAVSEPRSALRQKLLMMTAILETRPALADLFLPRERSVFYPVAVGWIGCRAVVKMIAGKILLLLV
jgi:hypothetical protein